MQYGFSEFLQRIFKYQDIQNITFTPEKAPRKELEKIPQKNKVQTQNLLAMHRIASRINNKD